MTITISDNVCNANIQSLKQLYVIDNEDDIQWFANTYPNTVQILEQLHPKLQLIKIGQHTLSYQYNEQEHENYLTVDIACVDEQEFHLRYQQLIPFNIHMWDNILVNPVIK